MLQHPQAHKQHTGVFSLAILSPLDRVVVSVVGAVVGGATGSIGCTPGRASVRGTFTLCPPPNSCAKKPFDLIAATAGAVCNAAELVDRHRLPNACRLFSSPWRINIVASWDPSSRVQVPTVGEPGALAGRDLPPIPS